MDDGGDGSSGIGTGPVGGKHNKGKGVQINQTRLEAEIRREQARKALEDGGPAEELPFPEDFGDGSRIDFTWTRTHMHLLDMIIAQTRDDCWAWALVRILQFFYNMNVTVVAERKTLSIKSLVKHVILGKKEAGRAAATRKLEKRNLAVSTLKKAIDYIRDVGIERDHGSKLYTIKARIVEKPNATPQDILTLLPTQGPIGISIDMDEMFSRLEDNGIHIVQEPKEGMKRHALIIVGHGRTKDNQLFFIVQNTWGTSWRNNGYARIIIEKTCPIFYVDSLLP